jgi:hypothetical protein
MTEWLTDFFSELNGWDLDKIKQRRYPPNLQAPLERMVWPAIKETLPVVLPHLDANKQLWFFVLGNNGRELGELKNIVSAYLGTVRTILDPHIYKHSDDFTEIVLLKKFPQGFFKLNIPVELSGLDDKTAVYSIMDTLNAVVDQFSSRPTHTKVLPRPIGRILRDFFIACEHHDAKGAKKFFEEAESSRAISIRNLLSLELQVHSVSSDWNSLLNHPHLSEVLSCRISGVITGLMLEAVQRVYLPSDRPDDYNVPEVRENLAGLSPLFNRLPSIQKDSGNLVHWRIWAIGAASYGFPHLIEQLPSERLGEDWITRLRQWAEIGSENIPKRKPLLSALDAEPTATNATTLLEHTLSLGADECQKIYERLSGYPLEVIQEIQSHRTLDIVWQRLVEDFSPQIEIDSWSAWLKSLVHNADAQMTIEKVNECSRNWSPKTWNEKEVTSLLASLVDNGKSTTLRDVTPLLRNWLASNDVKTSGHFIEQILFLLAADDMHSVQDLLLMSDFLSDLIEVPHTAAQYRDAINSVIACWEKIQSANSINRGLEIMDVLLDSPCADNQSRLDLWNALQGYCFANWNRLGDDQQLMVCQVGEEITGSRDQFPPLRLDDSSVLVEHVDLSGKLLAIYTLTEGAARRAGSVLDRLFPGLDIQLNHDKTATDTLKALAKKADFFIFASKSAAHQAFYPVTNIRKDIIYPSGKGFSSIVSGFLEAVA